MKKKFLIIILIFLLIKNVIMKYKIINKNNLFLKPKFFQIIFEHKFEINNNISYNLTINNKIKNGNIFLFLINSKYNNQFECNNNNDELIIYKNENISKISLFYEKINLNNNNNNNFNNTIINNNLTSKYNFILMFCSNENKEINLNINLKYFNNYKLIFTINIISFIFSVCLIFINIYYFLIKKKIHIKKILILHLLTFFYFLFKLILNKKESNNNIIFYFEKITFILCDFLIILILFFISIGKTLKNEKQFINLKKNILFMFLLLLKIINFFLIRIFNKNSVDFNENFYVLMKCLKNIINFTLFLIIYKKLQKLFNQIKLNITKKYIKTFIKLIRLILSLFLFKGFLYYFTNYFNLFFINKLCNNFINNFIIIFINYILLFNLNKIKEMNKQGYSLELHQIDFDSNSILKND